MKTSAQPEQLEQAQAQLEQLALLVLRELPEQQAQLEHKLKQLARIKRGAAKSCVFFCAKIA
jgi:hypothetical protein